MLCTQILGASALLLRWRANGPLCEPWETASSSDAARRRPGPRRFGDPLGVQRAARAPTAWACAALPMAQTWTSPLFPQPASLGPFRQQFCARDDWASTALNRDARKHARAPSGSAFSPALRRRAPPCLAPQPRTAQTHVARLTWCHIRPNSPWGTCGSSCPSACRLYA